MLDDGGVVRTTRVLDADEQRALVAQLARCALRDAAGWLGAATVVGLGVAFVRGDLADAGCVVLLALVLAVGRVRSTRAAARAAHPVGAQVETVLSPHRLDHGPESCALPQVTGVRAEGRLVRLEVGRDHRHLLPGHVDLDLLRLRAGAPAPGPEAGPDVVVVPRGLGVRAGTRRVTWSVVRDGDTAWLVALAAVALAVGFPGAAAFLVLALIGSAVLGVVVESRQFDRAFPAGLALALAWRGPDLVVRSAQGECVVPVGPVRSLRERGDLVVVRRPEGAPLPLPAVVLTDAGRAHLRTN